MLDNYLKDLAELVNLDCGTENCQGVSTVAAIMKRHFESIGFTAELVDLGPGVGHGLFATNKPQAQQYDLLMNAHLDTVFADGTAAERPMRIEGNNVFGPGCSDCKSGVLSIFYSLKMAAKQDLNRLAIAVCLNPDEETGSAHSHAWISEYAAKSKRALVSEAARAGGELVRSRKGRGAYTVLFHGVAAHAGNNPKDGHSAILPACRFSLQVSALQDLETKGTSVNVGVIQGGAICNGIPDRCKLEIDTRYWNDADGAEIDAAIHAMLAQDWGEGVSVELVHTAKSPAMPCTDATKDLVSLIEQAARLEGFEAAWVDAGGGSDANIIAQMGTPVVDGVGPAGGGFHCEKEFLRVDTIEERTRMMTRFLSLI